MVDATPPSRRTAHSRSWGKCSCRWHSSKRKISANGESYQTRSFFCSQMDMRAPDTISPPPDEDSAVSGAGGRKHTDFLHHLRRYRESRAAEELCRSHLFLSFMCLIGCSTFFGKGRNMGWKWSRHVPLSFSFLILHSGSLGPVPVASYSLRVPCFYLAVETGGMRNGGEMGGRRKSDNTMVRVQRREGWRSRGC